MSNKFQDNINAQLAANNHGLKWADKYLRGNQKKDTKRSLIQNRINLKRIAHAASVNAGAAIFGASQVGKSYMGNYLLASKSTPTRIYNSKGGSVGFLSSVNPTGNGKEATALITRFSTKNLCGANPDYPYQIVMLSPTDLVLVIVDSYFNDIDGQIVPDKEEIEAEIIRLDEKYASKPKCQDIISVDSIYEILEYFNGPYLSKRPDFKENLISTGFFENLGNLISSIPVDEWVNVFGFFWGHHPVLSEIFVKLIKATQRLKFSRKTFVGFEAIDKTEGTILHVDRLYELVGLNNLSEETVSTLEVAKVKNINVMTEDGNIVRNIPKDVFCAIAQEVDFTIADPTDSLSAAELESEKPMLAKMDVLDFPGARSREEIPVSNLGYDSAVTMIVRGKVAYLFNKYSSQYLISSLLFCQDERQAEVKSLPKLVGGWVEKTVGRTLDERTSFLNGVGGISPLLMIATKFNTYLRKDDSIMKEDREQAYYQMLVRWKRFASAIRNVAHIKGAEDSWFDQWTETRAFSAIFPLRAFLYSQYDGLYEGYKEKNDKIISEENGMSAEFKSYFSVLEDSFLDPELDFIRSHFDNPKKTWDSVTEIGSDGSRLILEYMKGVADKMSNMRNLIFERVLQSAFDSLISNLVRYYHDDNAATQLTKQRKTAGRLRMSMNILFGKDKELFSDLISRFVVDESNLHDVVLDTINAVDVVEETDNDALFAIRETAGISFNDPYEENLERLMAATFCDSIEELEAELANYELTIEQIITPNKIKNISIMIAEAVESKWKDSKLQPESYSDFMQRGMKEDQINDLLANLDALYSKKIKLSDIMAERIHSYVSGAISLDEMADMIADICAQIVNKFVTSMGAAYYSESDWQSISDIKDKLKLPGSLHRESFMPSRFNDKEIRNSLPDLLNAFDRPEARPKSNLIDQTSHMSNWIEFRRWMDLMEISFLATIGIPTYDVEMNDSLRNILKKYVLDSYALHKYAEANKKLSKLVSLKQTES
ncbi:MAG: putative virulence factor [Muribaculaceae bacterium]|nr:putative virulence factor [Muribaculaceae bacterium]